VKLIVSDASPLIVIARTGLIPVLNEMVEEVVIPEAVYAECTRNPRLPGADALHAAVVSGRIHVRPDAAGSDGGPDVEGAGLGAGELAAIRLALALHCPVLMDERLGRQAARRHKLTVIGSAGLLIVAKQRGLIPAVAPILDQWRKSGYFLSSAIVTAVLERVGEA
jgi:predicted nucleic acid-binding protein